MSKTRQCMAGYNCVNQVYVLSDTSNTTSNQGNSR